MSNQYEAKRFISIDANATFNPLGEIKPMYIRLEDEEHQLHTYKIESISSIKDEKYAGIHAILFVCNIRIEDCMREIKIRYYIPSHKWMLA
ncbi:MAG: hypothetical protein ACERKZ_09740 [Lachnotalea sp.]